MLPHEAQELLIKILFGLFALSLITMSRAHAFDFYLFV